MEDNETIGARTVQEVREALSKLPDELLQSLALGFKMNLLRRPEPIYDEDHQIAIMIGIEAKKRGLKINI